MHVCVCMCVCLLRHCGVSPTTLCRWRRVSLHLLPAGDGWWWTRWPLRRPTHCVPAELCQRQCNRPQVQGLLWLPGHQIPLCISFALHYSVRLAVPALMSGDHTPSLAAEQEPVASRCTVPSVSWLVGVLLPRIAQWAGEGGAGMAQTSPAHHCLVPLERFAATYSRMKEQYGRHLVQVRVI